MSPAGDIDLATAAALLHRSYSWFQKNWRSYRHPATGLPAPLPFIGAGRGQRPWWRRAQFEAWIDGAAEPPPLETSGDFPQRAAANDAASRPPSDRAAALRAAAGG